MHLYMYVYIWKGVPRYIFPLFIELKTCAFPVRNMLITVKEPERIPGISWFIKNPINSLFISTHKSYKTIRVMFTNLATERGNHCIYRYVMITNY